MKRFSAILAVFGVAVMVTVAAAQEVRTINGGVLNGKATSLPKPAYPESAKAAKLDGTIAVDVLINEAGMVVSAKADPNDQRQSKTADGSKAEPVAADPALIQAAEEAAMKATFAPTLLNGQPVQIKGRIVYNFVASDGPQGDVRLKVVSPTYSTVVDPNVPRLVSGGVLNGKAESLPSPAYPPAAKAVAAQGAVTVQVIIDEGGNVISAAAVSGHPLLRAASEEAARSARFSPTLLQGQPVKVSGVITYNFVLPKKAEQ